MIEPFLDPSIYTSIPVVSLSTLRILARTLIKAAPRGLPALTQRALAKIEQRVQKAEAAQAARQRTLGSTPDDVRAVDVAADRSIAAIRQRLEAYATLPAEDFPRAERAQELLTMLFPEGLGFLKLPYIEQLAEMEILFKRIDEEELAADLDALCGPEFLRNFRSVLPRYRAMVQAGLQRAGGSEDLAEHRIRLAAAIVDYAIKVAATHDEEDPRSLDRIRAALRPIDALREQISRRAGSGDEDPSDPDVPADPGMPPAPPPGP